VSELHEPIGAYYHKPRLEPAVLRNYVTSAVDGLEEEGVEFDAIVMQGISGMLVGLPVAYEMHKLPVIVRKPLELGEATDPVSGQVVNVGYKHGRAHSEHLVEGGYAGMRYIVFDDQITSGATMKRIKEAIDLHRPESVCVGVALYVQEYGDWDTVFNVPRIRV
jgi:adenine/guanine phosphoribosyltransferase-like PRPP-binding protein